MIEVNGLMRMYGKLPALAGVSFRVEAGQIAGLLGLSVRTVENHRAGLMGKLGLVSRVELVNYAEEHNLL